MQSWDEVSEFYKVYAGGKHTRDIDFGNGMLDLIQLLRRDPDIKTMHLGTAMNWLLVALPDYDLQSVHIQWAAPDIYEIFLTPDINQKPDITTVSLSDAVSKVKEYLYYLREKKANHNQ
jgi:hypothetical protein